MTVFPGAARNGCTLGETPRAADHSSGPRGDKRPAIRAAYAPDGSVDLTAQGALSGSPEERCVQDALDGVRVPATGQAGVVVHLVR